MFCSEIKFNFFISIFINNIFQVLFSRKWKLKKKCCSCLEQDDTGNIPWFCIIKTDPNKMVAQCCQNCTIKHRTSSLSNNPMKKTKHNKPKNRNKAVNLFLPFTKTIYIFQFFILHQIFTKHLFSMHAARYPVLKVRVKC